MEVQTPLLVYKRWARPFFIVSAAFAFAQSLCLVLFLDRMGSEGLALGGGHMSCPFYNWLWSYVFKFTKPSHWFRAAGCFTGCLLLELHLCVSAHVMWREGTSLVINSVLAIRHLWYCWFWWNKEEKDWTGKTMELLINQTCVQKYRTDHYMVYSVQMLSSGSIPIGGSRDFFR